MTGAEVVAWGRPSPVAARVNWGRWIADCPACTSALEVERGDPRLGAYVTVVRDDVGPVEVFRPGCFDCGTRVEVVWPSAAFCDGVERLLMMRPDPATRNWSHPETLHDLMTENALHGVFDPVLELAAAAEPGTELLAVDDDRVVVDLLPPTPALTGHRRQQIGA